MNFNHTKTFTDSYMDIFRNHTKGESEWDSILISYFIYIASVTIKMLCKCLAPKQTAVVGNLEQDQAHMPTHASYMQIHSLYRRCTQLAAFPNEKVPESIKFHSRVLEAKAMRKSSPVYTAEAVTWPHTGRLLIIVRDALEERLRTALFPHLLSACFIQKIFFWGQNLTWTIHSFISVV